MDPSVARALWHRLETINAVAYFTPECADAPTRLGLKGFWMGYFGCRAAPMGSVSAGTVEATFYNFHPSRVRRAIPDAWSLTTPEALVAARAAAAAAALRRLLGDSDAEALAGAATPALHAAINHGSPGGHPLFAANAELRSPADPVAALWQAATTMREERGDSHVALLTGAGLDGCEVHVLAAAADGVAASLYQQSRGWSDDDWAAAVERLATRHLVEGDGALTDAGRSARASIERRTDELSIAPYEALGDNGVAALLAALEPAATRIAASGEIGYPNPMGLPAVT